MKKSIHHPLDQYKVIVFDLDGTLYYQPPLRLLMAGRLSLFYLFHPFRIKELFLLMEFRKMRETWPQTGETGGEGLDQDQYRFLAEKKGLSPARVKRVVEYWLYQAPINLLPHVRDRYLTAWMAGLRRRGKLVVVYSDYPVTDKLRALNLTVDGQYSALDKEIGCLKPNPKGLRYIMRSLGTRPGEVLMIGDRMKKDGLAAHKAHVDFIILPPWPFLRRAVLKELTAHDKK